MSNVVINPFVFGAAAPAFVPTDFSNQEFWYDATDAATITDSSGEVTDWTDKFNSHDLSQGTAARRPNTSTINSIDGIFFDGDDVLEITGDAFTIGPCTQWGLITPTDPRTGHLWSLRDSGLERNIMRIQSGSQLTAEVKTSGGSFSLVNISVAFDGVTIAWIARHASATAAVIISDDGTTATDPVVGTLFTSATDLFVGADSASGGNGYDGHLHHLGMYSQRLNDTDTDTLMDYLKTQGGL